MMTEKELAPLRALVERRKKAMLGHDAPWVALDHLPALIQTIDELNAEITRLRALDSPPKG